jgi:tetratricopeptide (TPR) repeat protein
MMNRYCRRVVLAALLLPLLHSDFASAFQLPGGSTSTALTAGAEALRDNHPAEAVQDFSSVVRLQPRFAPGFLDLGLALQQTGDLPRAKAALQKAIALMPNLRGAHLFLGITEYQSDEYAEAESALRLETQLDPKDAKAWMWLGVDQLSEGRHEAAAASLDKAYSLAPDDTDILYHRGRAHFLVSQDSYEKMFRVDPNSFRVHEVLGQADAAASRTEDAINEYQLALKSAPHEIGLHEALGDLYWTEYKMQLAEPEYLDELGVDPDSVTANYKLGGLRVISGNPSGAIQPLEQAIRLDPTFEKAVYYLGRAYADMGQDDKAIPWLKKAIADSDDKTLKALAWYQLTRIYRLRQQTAEADAALAQFRILRSAIDAKENAKRTTQDGQGRNLPHPEQLPPANASGEDTHR